MAPFFYPISAAALLGGAAAMLIVRIRRASHRRAIAADLEKRHCRLVRAQLRLNHLRLLGAFTYDVEYLDNEGDPGEARCTVSRGGGVAWGEELSDLRGTVVFAQDLPTYGQNWRG